MIAIAALLQGEAGALAPALQDKDIERALKLARTREEMRAQFHAPYIVRVHDATVEQIEVVSEFRRYVLTAEEKVRMGNWLFARSIRDAQEALKPWRGRLSLVARLRFHPQNALATIPPYAIAVVPDVEPLAVVRTPINAMRSGGRGDLSAPLVGATIEVVFDAAAIGQARRPVIVSLTGQEVARVTIDFAGLE